MGRGCAWPPPFVSHHSQQEQIFLGGLYFLMLLLLQLLALGGGWFSWEGARQGGWGEVPCPSSSLSDPHKLLVLWIPLPPLLLFLQETCPAEGQPQMSAAPQPQQPWGQLQGQAELPLTPSRDPRQGEAWLEPQEITQNLGHGDG